MNIYLIEEVGDNFCIKGKSMAEAVLVCENSAIEVAMNNDKNSTYDYEKEYYHQKILKSCTLIGVLKN